MTDDELNAIERRMDVRDTSDAPCTCHRCLDVHALIAEVRRLRSVIDEALTIAHNTEGTT